MPEIPEMEIYKDYLSKSVKNKRISDVHVLRVKSINLESADFCRSVIGKRIVDITRKGKYILQSVFKVYDRLGKPCTVCQTCIEKSEVGGRKTLLDIISNT